MARRTPPTTTEIIDALNTQEMPPHHRPDQPRLGDDRAVHFDNAIDLLQAAFHTNRAKAREWLITALLPEDSPLAAIWTSRQDDSPVRVMTGPNEGRPLDWPPEVHRAVQFLVTGALVQPPYTYRDAPTSPFPWVVYRDALPRLRARIEADLAQRQRERETPRPTAATTSVLLHSQERDHEQHVQLAEFRAVHGDALDVITEFLERIHPPDAPPRHRLLTTDTGQEETARLFGSPGELIIRLCGDQIEAFAREIEPLRGDAI